MNKVLEHVKITGFTHRRNVIQAAMRIVGKEVGMRKSNAKKKMEPFWKRRILSRVEAWFAGRWKNDKSKEKDLLDQKYGLRRKGFSLVMEELKQRITAKATKVKRYDNRIKQFQGNRNFQTNQGRFLKNLEGKKERTKPPMLKMQQHFGKEYGWIGKVKENMPSEKQNTVNNAKDDVKRKLKSMPDWKGAGPDKIQGFWLKSFTALHGVPAAALNECIEAGDVPGWLVEGRTILVMKDSKNGTEVGNYRPIACLNLIWKLLTGIISDKTYDHLQKNRLLPEEQKGSRRKCQGTKDQLAIDRCILQNCRKRKTNLSMAWVDYKKAYDMVPHSWIIDTMGMVGLADNIIGLIKQSMNKWKTNLYADGKLIGSVPIRRGIFQGDSFSPLLFVIALLPLTHILRETGMGYQLEKNGAKVNHLFFMDDLKLYEKDDKEIDSLIKTLWQCLKDIKIFGILKCAAVSLQRGKKTRWEGIQLPSGEEIGEAGVGGYKYVGVLELDKIMCDEMKRKVKEVYQKRITLLMKTHLNGKDLFLALNTWVITVIRYSAAFLDWTKEETKELNRWTRKQLIAGRALHPNSNVMRIYIKRRYGGRGLISVEECCAAELRIIDFYLANNEEELLKVVARLEKLGKDQVESKKDYNKRIEQEKLDQLRSMKLHGQFERDTDDKKSEKSWHWLRNGNLKRETESLLAAAQEQALNTNSVRKIYHKDVSNKCRLCGTHMENVLHIVSGCSMLAQKEYKRRHGKVCLNIHWVLCKKFGVKVCERWYEHKVESVIENDIVKILWDVCIQVDRQIEHRRPDIVVMEKNTNKCLIIDVACPVDNNLILKRNEKLDNYSELRLEIARMWDKETLIVQGGEKKNKLIKKKGGVG